MAAEVKGVGRTREITGALYLERWLQMDAGTDLIYGESGDLNRIDALADSRTASSGGRMWYGPASPGEYDAGERRRAWYGQIIRVPFRRLQATEEWHTLKADLLAFVEEAFPDELLLEESRRFQQPAAGDVNAPAKYVLWAIDFE